MAPISWLVIPWLLAAPVQLERISSAEVCGRCHREILQAWKTSLHATALEDPLFQDALDRAVEEFGAKARPACLACHAPMVQHSGDTGLIKKVSWEGITCDFCHSLKSATMSGGVARLNIVFDGIKTGPLKDAASGAHGVAFSPVHTSSVLCAGCHEYRNGQGLAVLTTYSEWEGSSYSRKNVQCQACHMAATNNKRVNLHQMPGGHSVEQLNKAVALRLTSAREGGVLKLNVEVTNRGAGHMVPTGSPLRRLHLDVRVNSSDGKSYQAERVYQRTVLDGAGREVHAEHRVFISAARVKQDTRLKPDERRIETFSFPAPQAATANIRAQMWYYYSPLADSEQRNRIAFLNVAHYAPAGR